MRFDRCVALESGGKHGKSQGVIVYVTVSNVLTVQVIVNKHVQYIHTVQSSDVRSARVSLDP